MVTADWTVLGYQMNIGTSGVVECIIPSLMLGDGIYSVMIDTGTYDFTTKSQVTQDCVAYATYIQVSLDGQLKGKGIDEFEGSVHRSDWSVVE